jgi:polyhydroxyalkanoate synthesis regulator phasin
VRPATLGAAHTHEIAVVAYEVGDDTMAQPLDVRRLLATGRQITETGRTQAVQLGTDLVEQGRQATDQISAVVDELVNRGGRERIEELRQTVRGEVQQPLHILATQGQLVADRIAAAIEDLREAVRDEVQRQMSTLGLATREDLAGLGRTIREDLAALEGRLDRQTASPTTGGEESARQAAAMQMTPPHQRAMVIDQPST